jgi:tRNA (cmo5U34)-methyltransferase
MSTTLDEENLFTGPIGAEYEMLRLICPNAATLAGKLGEYVGAWKGADESSGGLKGFEIGCGTGISTLSLLSQRRDLHLLAIDSSAKMLEQARSNLAQWASAGRVEFIEADALEALKRQETDSIDVVASNYATHNFMGDYRKEIVKEIFRALKPGGLFLNGDRFAIDDLQAHLRLTQSEVRHWFKTFTEIDRLDLLQEWVVHLFSDESPEHIMYFAPAIEHLRATGFEPVQIEFREGVDTLVAAFKPSRKS